MPEVCRFPYYSQTGFCLVENLGGHRPFKVYSLEGDLRRFLESYPTQRQAEGFARWMAMGL